MHRLYVLTCMDLAYLRYQFYSVEWKPSKMTQKGMDISNPLPTGIFQSPRESTNLEHSIQLPIASYLASIAMLCLS